MEPPFSDNLKEIADSMGIALYQRFSVTEASLFLRCPIADIKRFRRQGEIDSITITDTKFEFFGYQLLQYLLNSTTQNAPSPQAPAKSVDRIIRAKEAQDNDGAFSNNPVAIRKNGKLSKASWLRCQQRRVETQ